MLCQFQLNQNKLQQEWMDAIITLWYHLQRKHQTFTFIMDGTD
jgi:hypothetical protein